MQSARRRGSFEAAMRQRGRVRGWVVTAIAVAVVGGCSFEGAAGREPVPDEADAMIDAGVDSAPVGVDAGPMLPPITCEGFTPIAGSHYRLLSELVTVEVARQRCDALPGAHLATFETLAEPAAVVTGLLLTAPAWTGVEQVVNAGQRQPGDDWYNRVGTVRTPIPLGFPWRQGEPNDFTSPENGQEDFAELHPPGVFDDGGGGRSSRPLCECVPRS
jgi:hypothetical protein